MFRTDTDFEIFLNVYIVKKNSSVHGHVHAYCAHAFVPMGMYSCMHLHVVLRVRVGGIVQCLCFWMHASSLLCILDLFRGILEDPEL